MNRSQSNPPQNTRGVVLSWDLYALAFLALSVFFQVCQWPLFPRFLDIYYHIGVVRGFAEAGGYVPWSFWEYAPVGRPHLYPPFLHWLLLGPYLAGVPFIEIARLVDCLSFPALLGSGWLLARRLTGERAAFIWLVLFGSLYSVYLAASTLPAFNLAFVLTFLSLAAALGNKDRPAAVLAGLVFYSHLLGAAFCVCAYGVWALVSKKGHRQKPLRILIAALIIGSPMVIYALCWSHWFARLALRENFYFDLDPWLLAACAAGLFFVRKNFRDHALALSLLVSGLAGTLFYPIRCISGQGLFGVAVLAAIGINGWITKMSEKNRFAAAVAGSAVVLAFAFVLPVLDVNLKTSEVKARWFDRTLTRFCVNTDRLAFKARGFTVYFPEEYGRLAELIKAHSGPSDILWSSFPHAAGILSLLTHQRCSSAMLPEVLPGAAFDPVGHAKVSVWFKDRQGRPTEFMNKVVSLYGLSRAGETDLAFVYLNPAAIVPRAGPSKAPAISWWVLVGYFIVLSAIACQFVRKNQST